MDDEDKMNAPDDRATMIRALHRIAQWHDADLAEADEPSCARVAREALAKVGENPPPTRGDEAETFWDQYDPDDRRADYWSGE